MVSHIRKEGLFYPACASEGCNKKVTQDGMGWRCERCDKSWPNPQYRFIASVALSDHTGQQYVQSFNETSELIFGVTANDLSGMQVEPILLYLLSQGELFTHMNHDFRNTIKHSTTKSSHVRCTAKEHLNSAPSLNSTRMKPKYVALW